MPQGIQIWDASGVLLLDTSTIVVKTGSVDIGRVTASGSQNVAALQTGGNTVLAMVKTNDEGMFTPKVTVSGSTVAWTAPTGQAIDANIRLLLL